MGFTDYESMKLIKLMRTASYPWTTQGKSKSEKGFEQYDSKEKINTCLNCKLSRCINCQENMGETIRVLYNAGLGRDTICKLLSVSRGIYYRAIKGVGHKVAKTG